MRRALLLATAAALAATACSGPDDELPGSFPVLGQRVWEQMDGRGSVTRTVGLSRPARQVSVQLACTTPDETGAELLVTTPLGSAGTGCPSTSDEGEVSMSLPDDAPSLAAGDFDVAVEAPGGTRWAVVVTVDVPRPDAFDD